MGWDEDENVEAQLNTTMWNGNNLFSNPKKKKNRKNHKRGDAAHDPAQDAAQSKFGSSFSWGSSSSSGHLDDDNTINNNTQRLASKQGLSSQVGSRFSGSQEQKGWTDSSSHRSVHHQTRASNLPPTASWAKSSLPATSLQKDGKAKLRFSGAAQRPARWNDVKDKNNKALDEAYKRRGFRDESNAQKNHTKNDKWTIRRSEGWRPGNKHDLASLPQQRAENNWQSARMNSNWQSSPSQGWQCKDTVNNSPLGSGPETSESAEISYVRNNVLPKLLPSDQSEGAGMPYDVGYQSRSGSEPEIMEEGSDDDWLLSDDYESDASVVSHEAQKKDKAFRKFFQSLDALTIEEINESARQWHCPACQGGVGAIDWYNGMQPLLSHAKTVRSKRVKLHRKLAEVLEEELKRRGAAGLAAEEMFGKWKGLQEVMSNHMIIWPPMVVIQNTLLEQDEKNMWIGMGNKELLEYFKGYKAMKARHAYGPQGHRGMSMLIFENASMGYLEAERLHQHFVEEGRDRDAWERRRVLFYPGGKRVLYGYMATKDDLEIFNRHSKGKAGLKYEIKTYQSMVVEPMKQMDEDNQRLIWFKNRVAKQQQHSRTLEETVSLVGRKLQMKEKEIKIIRQRASEQHEESKREMDYLEKCYKEQIDQLFEDIMKREHVLEKMQGEFKKSHLERCHQLEVDRAKLPKDTENGKDEQEQQAKIEEEIARQTAIVETSVKDNEEYERERQELIKGHDKRRKQFKLIQLQGEIDFEKEFEQERLQILEKYAKRRQEAAQSINLCSEHNQQWS